MKENVLFKQSVLWVPRWWLVLLLVIVSIVIGILVVKNIAHYLAVTEPKQGDYLIVEGWQSESSLQQALAVFNSDENNYHYLITTGGPNTNQIKPQYKNYAEQSAAFLLSQGLDLKKLIVIATPASAQDRTFLSAVMVREWFQQQNSTPQSFDVFSQGVHARRTQTLYKKAFQQIQEIGIYASKPADYVLSSWWTTSVGAKSVITESIGLAWVACCFNPGSYGSQQEKWGVKL